MTTQYTLDKTEWQKIATGEVLVYLFSKAKGGFGWAKTLVDSPPTINKSCPNEEKDHSVTLPVAAGEFLWVIGIEEEAYLNVTVVAV